MGLRKTGPNDVWHIDTTVIRLLDGSRAYLHAVIDNYSRRILAWQVADAFAPANSVAVLLAASQGATPSEHAPSAGGCGCGERERADRRPARHGCAAPLTGRDGVEMLELDDRSLVAFAETPLAVSCTRSTA